VRVDYLICDEVSFYTVEHIEQMADLVDCYDVDVFAFGLASDFRSRLFPAAQRLFELADEVARIQVEVLCWCGRPGLLNARVVDGAVAREGEQVVIGDTAEDAEVRYQVLCRRHHRTGDLGPRS
jgi:thymidine kinase